MHLIRTATLVVVPAVLFAVSARAANKEHEAMARDLALLSADVQKMQRSIEDQMLTIKTLLSQVINDTGKSLTQGAGLEVKMTERMQTLERSVNQSMASLNAKIDTMTDEFRRVREDVGDLRGKMNRMDQQLADIKTAVTVIQSAPRVEAPAPPPTAETAPPAETAGPPAGVSAQSLFDGAMRDKSAGRPDLALNQFQDYIKWFSQTESACVAQYQIGEIYMGKQDLVSALVAFDTVLEKYGKSCSHYPNALFMKARALEKGGQPTSAAQEYRKLREDFPGSDWDRKATASLRALGFSTTAPTRKKR
ncbi:MAG: tetratricopeptide repeat protein [Bryobacteraceae bacterium]